MKPEVLALAIVALIVLATIVFALSSVRRFKMDPHEYIVGSRSFGALLLWILLAGEIYTSFTFLGAAGWAYAKGAATFYILGYGTIAYCIGFFLLPALWKVGNERKLFTLPDFFIDRYGSKALGLGVALLQFFLVIPYVTLQLTGLQILLKLAGYERYNANVAVAIAFVLMALFVFTAGLRGTAWASVIKDTLVLGAVLFAGIAIPMRFFGSLAAMIDHILRSHPGWLTLPPSGAGNAIYTVPWFVTTVLLTGIGFFMGPANAPAIYSARSAETLRRNMIFMPLYQLILLFVFFAGLSALAIVPGLKGPTADQSFMLAIQRFYSPVVLGIIAGAGCLAALLPASTLLLGAASVFSKNVLRDAIGFADDDRTLTWSTRVLVLIIAALALILWIYFKTSLVDLLLFYYNGITQLAPGVFFALLWRRINAWAIGAGLLAGEFVAYYSLHHSIAPWGINPGFFALVVNVLVCVAVVLMLQIKEPAAVATGSL
ncbi:MAG TPA: sodium:solute symporter family protein [Candidatus Rubrimentiphilum sp.]|nr:sodium:solute symporter family protein [Candidatus Rubrimentiphilum sp.]